MSQENELAKVSSVWRPLARVLFAHGYGLIADRPPKALEENTARFSWLQPQHQVGRIGILDVLQMALIRAEFPDWEFWGSWQDGAFQWDLVVWPDTAAIEVSESVVWTEQHIAALTRSVVGLAIIVDMVLYELEQDRQEAE